ncbi:MAG: SufD family Fe-S cluster assembly protein [Planctomycetes bacterium]|nr:SufD family Fe-S cluster assembly protein [Planctomycetota bacterium]
MVDPLLADLRAAARARAQVLGLPTPALEDWRYVRCQPLAAAPAGGPGGAAGWEGACLDLADGVPAVRGDWGAGWRLRLPDAAEVAVLHDGLDRAASATACWPLAEAGSVQVLEAAGAAAPLALRSIAGGSAGWVLLLRVAPGAQARLALIHAGPGRSSVQIEAVLGAGASLSVDEVQTGVAGQLLVHARVRLERDARLAWTAAGRGGALVRHALAVDLAAAGAEVAIATVDRLDGEAQAHRHTRVVHAGRTRSGQMIRTVLAGRSLAGFDGCVHMPPGADGSEAELQDRNLLLSPEARADARPQLDIRADDVKAAHGVTVGQLPPEELLYLRMRGLPLAAAAPLLTRGHLDAVAGRMVLDQARALARHELGIA